jgi:hypothetical protein
MEEFDHAKSEVDQWLKDAEQRTRGAKTRQQWTPPGSLLLSVAWAGAWGYIAGRYDWHWAIAWGLVLLPWVIVAIAPLPHAGRVQDDKVQRIAQRIYEARHRRQILEATADRNPAAEALIRCWAEEHALQNELQDTLSR